MKTKDHTTMGPTGEVLAADNSRSIRTRELSTVNTTNATDTPQQPGPASNWDEIELRLRKSLDLNNPRGRYALDFAREVSDDVEMPKCIKFLAGVAVEIHGRIGCRTTTALSASVSPSSNSHKQ